MKSSRKSFVILVLQVALVMVLVAALAVAKEDGLGVGATKVSDDTPCCNDCKDLYSGLVRCDDVRSKCRAGCEKCVLVKGHAMKKQYRCADTYFGPCNNPCKKN